MFANLDICDRNSERRKKKINKKNKKMEYKGKVYAKINGKYIECTETVQQLKDKISKLQCALDKIANGTQPYNEREAFIFVDVAKQIASEAIS